MKIKKGDSVKVISGDDRGKTGTVLKAYPKVNKVLVEGVAAYKKHQKPSLNNQEGGVVTLYRPIDASKVAKIQTASKKSTKKSTSTKPSKTK
jgi:large subunit ribosomal protein L24